MPDQTVNIPGDYSPFSVVRTFIICMTILGVFFAGSPDLMDAIVEYIGRH